MSYLASMTKPTHVVGAIVLAGLGLHLYRSLNKEEQPFKMLALTNASRKKFVVPATPSVVGVQPFVRARIEIEKRKRTSGNNPFSKKFKLKNKSVGLDVEVDLPVEFDRKLKSFGPEFSRGVESFDYHNAVKLSNLFMRSENLFDKAVAGLGAGPAIGLKYLTSPLSATARGNFQAKMMEQGLEIKALPANFAPIDAENYIVYNPDDSLNDCYAQIITDSEKEEDVARSLAIVENFYIYDPQCKDPKSALCRPLLRMTGGRLAKPAAFDKISRKTKSAKISGGGDTYKTKSGEGISEGLQQAFKLAGIYTIRTKIYIMEKTENLWTDIRKVSADEVTDPLALALSTIYWTVMAFCPALAAVEYVALKSLRYTVTYMKAVYNYTCAGNKAFRGRSDKIKDYADVNRSTAMDFICQRCVLANEGKWVNKGYRPYFIADAGLKNLVSWWIYNPNYNMGDAADIKKLLAKRAKYSGEKGPNT